MNESVLKYSSFLLNFYGIQPNKRNTKGRIFLLFSLVISFFLFILSMINFKNAHSLEVYVKYHASFTTFGQMYLKLFVLIYFRKSFLEIFGLQETFWPLDDIRDDILRNNLKNILKKSALFLRIFTYVSLSHALFFICIPLFVPGQLPLSLWVPNKLFLNTKFIYVCEIIFVLMVTFIIVGFDMLFVALCAIVYVQLKYLNYFFANIAITEDTDIENLKNDLCLFLDYHKRLIEYVNKMAKIYSTLLLIQYLLTIIAMCMELIVLSISVSKSNVRQIMESLLYCVNVLLQLAFYCFPAATVSEEANKTPENIYNTAWYFEPTELKTYLFMIILRGQQGLYFKAGGLLTVDREMFTNIFRASLSFYSILKVVLEESDETQ